MSYIEDFNNIADASDKFYIACTKLRLAMTYSFNLKTQHAVSGFLLCLDNFDDELLNDSRLVKCRQRY